MKNIISRPGPEDNILTLSHMLSNRAGNAFTKGLDQYGISAAEWRVMLTLAQYDQVTARDITIRWAMDKMTISRAISNLELRDLITKHRNSVDKRSYILGLSAEGHTMYEKLLPIANHLYHELLKDMSKKQVKELHDSMVKLINHIDEVLK